MLLSEAPIYMRGLSRPGPTFKESVLVHAAARIFFYDSIDNIQGSWVKMGLPGLNFLLSAGINDVGGILDERKHHKSSRRFIWSRT